MGLREPIRGVRGICCDPGHNFAQFPGFRGLAIGVQGLQSGFRVHKQGFRVYNQGSLVLRGGVKLALELGDICYIIACRPRVV